MLPRGAFRTGTVGTVRKPCPRSIDMQVTNMANSKLKRLIEKRDAVNARIKQEQNKLSAGKRREDTRRKVLAGAAVLECAKRDNDFAKRLDAELKAFLVRDTDRALFGLPQVGNTEGDAPVTPNRAGLNSVGVVAPIAGELV